jgi:hypothetical protein
MARDSAPDTAPRTAPERDTGRAQVDPIPATVRCHEDADGIVVWLPADDTEDDTDDTDDDSGDPVDDPDGPQVDQA